MAHMLELYPHCFIDIDKESAPLMDSYENKLLADKLKRRLLECLTTLRRFVS